MAQVARDLLDAAERLRITEVFHSLQGEALASGMPTVFVRLTGCPLRCTYCDSEYAFHGGEWFDFDALIARVAGFDATHVCVTGGEPLAQPNCRAFLERLCDAGYDVSLETSGAIDIAGIDPRVSRVVDLKTPASGECLRNRWQNLDALTDHDQLKFVICDRGDFDWAVQCIRERELVGRCTIWMSPSWGVVEPHELAQWILESGLPVRLQLQLHKLLWGDVPGK
ncbi:MAG: 7-carboxy-7-deazaguanine synthase QueE [Pseudomonadota bacterium]